ncbi:hypothetical protein EIP91_012215 [Steccherinum ochraceum]|uniref:RanBP2-type domain-containing protein n=1 Tax=Steccherinum ochraceum TaxID=92696 RepID=A0A4R0RNH7_9APHY|nr:hypothetical protein EIP91_012215 [Steccherinum ochraceum]
MSAARPNTFRRHARLQNHSPYGRNQRTTSRAADPDKESSGWGLSNFILGLFRRTTPQYEEDAEDDVEAGGADTSLEDDNMIDNEPSIEEISPPQTQTKHTEPPRTPSVPSDDEQASASKVQQVSKFLSENSHRALNSVEVAGLVALLEGSVQEDPNPPFRFSPSPFTTPAPEMPPNVTFMGSSSSAPSLPTNGRSTSQTPGKSLAKNPNGVYRWQGAGSARPRTRYQSPGFGPSRSMPIRMKLTTSEAPTTDKKRRRVGQDIDTSVPQRTAEPSAGSASSKPAAGVNGSTPPASTSNGSPLSPPRIRTNNVSSKPTAPSVPSPLRQAWNQNDSPSPPHPASASKPTRAANIMSELIKEATPAPKPDFSNPYETTGPAAAKPATRRPVTKRSRAVASSQPAPKKEEKKLADLSPQKIIEATVPKGSKRSRPPPDVDSSIPRTDPFESAAPRRSNRLKSPEPTIAPVNGKPIVEDEDESPTKRQKKAAPTSVLLNGRNSTVIIEEVEDVDMTSSKTSSSSVVRPSQVIEPEEPTAPRQRSQSPTSTTSPTSPVRNPFGMKSSAPKAPSKLRYSIKPEGESDKGEDEDAIQRKAPLSFASFASQPPPPQPSTFPSRPPAPSSPPKSEAEIKAAVRAMAPQELPVFSFGVPSTSPGAGPGPSSQRSRDAAKAVSSSILPAFDFSSTARAAATRTDASPPSSSTPATAFDFAAAGLKQPGAPGDQWECTACMLKNPNSATEKCTICDAPRLSKPAPAAATGGFNWAASGLKPPEKASGNSWTCSGCMLLNPASATDKCTICDAPR